MGCLDDLSLLFGPIFFLTWFGLLSLQGRLFDSSAHRCLELLGGFICFAINTILWMLAALFFIFLLWVTDLAIGWALRVPSYLRDNYTDFCRSGLLRLDASAGDRFAAFRTLKPLYYQNLDALMTARRRANFVKSAITLSNGPV